MKTDISHFPWCKHGFRGWKCSCSNHCRMHFAKDFNDSRALCKVREIETKRGERESVRERETEREGEGGRERMGGERECVRERE